MATTNIIVLNLLETLKDCDLNNLNKLLKYDKIPVEFKSIEKENNIDKSNNHFVVVSALELYNKSNKKLCFLHTLYSSIAQFYGDDSDDFIKFSGSKNNVPDIECKTKSYVQQKYNIQLYIIYNLLSNYKIRTKLCDVSKEDTVNTEAEPSLPSILEKYDTNKKESIYDFLNNIQIYIYKMFSKYTDQFSDLLDKDNILQDHINMLISLEEKANEIIDITNLDVTPEKKVKKILELCNFKKLGKKQMIYVGDYEHTNSTNSWTSAATQSPALKSVLSAINSSGLTNLQRYTSLEALVAAYGKHIRDIGSNKSIRVFLPIGSILNYHPPNLNSHFSGKSRTPEQKQAYFDQRKTELKQTIETKLQLNQNGILKSVDKQSIKTYGDLRELLEDQTSFYIRDQDQITLFLSNDTMLELSESMKSDSDKLIETVPIHLKQDKSLNRKPYFEYPINNMQSYLYNNIETADYHLIVDGQNRYQVIRKVFQELLSGNTFKIEEGTVIHQIFIDTQSYYKIPNEICDKAISIRDRLESKFTGFVQSNSAGNTLDPEFLNKTKLQRTNVDYCGTQKKPNSNSDFNKSINLNSLIETQSNEPVVEEIHECQCYTKSGNKCKNKALPPGNIYCGKHINCPRKGPLESKRDIKKLPIEQRLTPEELKLYNMAKYVDVDDEEFARQVDQEIASGQKVISRVSNK